MDCQQARLGVEVVQRAGFLFGGGDGDIVIHLQAAGDRIFHGAGIVRLPAQLRGYSFGAAVERIEVVLAGVNEIAHLFVRHAHGLRDGAAFLRRVGAIIHRDGQFVAHIAVALVHFHHGARQLRVVVHHLR